MYLTFIQFNCTVELYNESEVDYYEKIQTATFIRNDALYFIIISQASTWL